MSMPDPYDGFELPAIGFKPEDDAIGESITITITDVRQIEFKGQDGKTKKGIVLEGVDADDVSRDWCGWNLHNKQQIAKCKPLIGDLTKITFEGRDKGAKNPTTAAKWFAVEVLKRRAVSDYA
jgi:hypothetical protein